MKPHRRWPATGMVLAALVSLGACAGGSRALPSVAFIDDDFSVDDRATSAFVVLDRNPYRSCTEYDEAAARSVAHTFRRAGLTQSPESLKPLVAGTRPLPAIPADLIIVAFVSNHQYRSVGAYASAHHGLTWPQSVAARRLRLGTVVVGVFDSTDRRAVWVGMREGGVPPGCGRHQDRVTQVANSLAAEFLEH